MGSNPAQIKPEVEAKRNSTGRSPVGRMAFQLLFSTKVLYRGGGEYESTRRIPQQSHPKLLH